MNSRRQILIAHYTQILRKAASWAGLVALIGTTMVATPVAAVGTQMGARSATPATLKGNATNVSYIISYKVSSTNLIKGTKIEICDSPLETTACAASASANTNSNGASLLTAGLTSLTGTACNTNAVAASGGTGPGVTGTSRIFSNATGNSPTSANACVLTINVNNNPSGTNQKYYLRISNWSDTAATATEYDFGAVALETVSDIVVSANVQESMTFCTGTSGASCAAIAGSTVKVGTTTDNILTNSTPSGGLSLMYIDTNAASGYTITYLAPTLTSGANVIGTPTGTQTMAACAATPTPNNDCFGINTAVNTATGLGSSAAPSGGVAPTCTGYNTGDSYKFAVSAVTTFCTIAAPTATTTYTVSYAAMSGPTTKTGAYSATFTWVATGNF